MFYNNDGRQVGTSNSKQVKTWTKTIQRGAYTGETKSYAHYVWYSETSGMTYESWTGGSSGGTATSYSYTEKLLFENILCVDVNDRRYNFSYSPFLSKSGYYHLPFGIRETHNKSNYRITDYAVFFINDELYITCIDYESLYSSITVTLHYI